MVKEVTAYEASDGKLFSSQKEAAKHDAILQLQKLECLNFASASAVVERAAEVFAALLPLVAPEPENA